MNEPLRLTIDYKTGDDGWIIASVPEVPGAHSQGRTRKEARANVIDALRGVLELRPLGLERQRPTEGVGEGALYGPRSPA